MNLNIIWEKHKRFLTQVFGGFAVFLILFLVAASYQDGAAEGRERVLTDNDDVGRRASKLDVTYDRETRLQDILENQAGEVLSRVSARENWRIDVPDEHDVVKFSSAKEKVYASFTGRAARSGVRYPDINEVNFPVDSKSSAEEWEDAYVELDVLQRALTVLVDQKVRSIEEIVPERSVAETVAENADLRLYRFPVRMTVTTSYDAMLRIIASFQEAEEFVAVTVQKVSAVEGSQDLSVEFEFAGIHLAEAREDESGRSPRRPGRFGRGGRG